MADKEAAFLASMQSANEDAGDNNVMNGGSSAQAESYSSDEYDPAQADPTPAEQAVSTILSPAASSTVLKHPSDVIPPDSLNPSATSIPNSTPLAPTSATVDRQSQSPSMSRTTSLTSNNSAVGLLPGTSEKILGNPSASASGVPATRNDTISVNRDSAKDHTSLPRVSVSTAPTSPSHVRLENGLHANVVLNGNGPAVPNAPAISNDSASSTENAPLVDAADKVSTPLKSESASKNEASIAHVAIPKARLPHDKIGMLEDRIKEDPRGDMDAWMNLIEEHKRRAKYDDARAVYERFFAAFPFAAEQWVAYAQMENDNQNRNAMEKIFQRTLMLMPYLPLWSLYLDHIRRLHNLTTDASGVARQTIHQAYDLALQQVGLDRDSGKLWQDYVLFIKCGPGIIGGSSWQDQQKMDLLRKTYQRAICVPTQATNILWKEYDGFEMGLNKMTGRKFLQDQSPAHMSARSSYTELQNITRNLRRTTLPVLPPALGFDGDIEYVEQLDIWRRWIQWEKDDPLVLKQEDIAAYRARIVFVYKHALMAMRFWPELWCDASEFCFSNEMESEGNDFLSQGILANPESCLLAFKRADRLELTTANEEGDESAIRRGAAVREPYEKVLTALYDLIDKATIRNKQEIARIEAHFAAEEEKEQNDIDGEEDDEPQEEGSSKEKLKARQIDSVKTVTAVQVGLLSRTLSHVWIALMRAMRRIQGKGGVNASIGGFRGAFSDARKRGRVTSDVYIAAALIEFHCYEPDTGRKIFERGLKLFQEDEVFAIEYIKHLVANNDHTNARVVFETAVTRLSQKPETASKAKPLYVFFHDFESRYGELTQIVKLEKRMADLFPEDPTLSLFSKRFSDQGFDPTAIRLIVSPAAQTRPKVIQSIETSMSTEQPQSIPVKNSPKRPLPSDESDNEPGRPRKLARGESPLKGAAGRRLDQLKRSRQANDVSQFENHPPPHSLLPPPLPGNVMFLLSIIPKAETYHATKFKAEELVRLIRETNIPNNMSQLPQPPGVRGPPPPQVQHLPPHMQHPPPVQQRPPMPPMPYPQYPNSQYNTGGRSLFFL